MFRLTLGVLIALAFFPAAVLAQKPTSLRSSELTESSGVATSLVNERLVWTHNDSGGKPRLYRFDRTSGDLRDTIELTDVANIDWEDLCSFTLDGKNYLAIADCGDNRKVRRHVEIGIVAEPQLQASQPANKESTVQKVTAALRLKVRYPDGPLDCEAIAFDPTNSRLVLFTKEFITCRLYAVPVDANLLKHGATSPVEVRPQLLQALSLSLVTGADICPQTGQLVLCNYGTAFLLSPDPTAAGTWDRKSIRQLKLPKRQQGEAISFLNANQLLLTSEGSPAPLWTMDIPAPE